MSRVEPSGAPGAGTGACPSDYALDAFELAGRPAGHPLRDHLAACVRCQDRLQERGRVQEAFRREVFPATVEAVVRAGTAARPTRGFWRGFAWPLAVGAAAALLLVVGVWIGSRHDTLSPDAGIGIKGPPAVQVFCKRGERVLPLRNGDPVQAGDRLRFVVGLSEPGYLRILSVDDRGAVTSFYPLEGADPVELPAGRQELPGSTRLDDSPGPERLLVLLSDAPLGWEDVLTVVRHHQAGGESTPVRALRHLVPLVFPKGAASP